MQEGENMGGAAGFIRWRVGEARRQNQPISLQNLLDTRSISCPPACTTHHMPSLPLPGCSLGYYLVVFLLPPSTSSPPCRSYPL